MQEGYGDLKHRRLEKKLQDEEFYALHSLPDLLGCSREKPLEKLRPIHGRIILKWIVKIGLEGRFIHNV